MERVILTTKQILQALPRIPLRRRSLRDELTAVFGWYHQDRPHTSLAGRTPDEVYSRRRPANRQPRLEPRARWPRAAPCARPQTLVAGQPGDRFTITVGFRAGRRNLPVVSLQRAGIEYPSNQPVGWGDCCALATLLSPSCFQIVKSQIRPEVAAAIFASPSPSSNDSIEGKVHLRRFIGPALGPVGCRQLGQKMSECAGNQQRELVR